MLIREIWQRDYGLWDMDFKSLVGRFKWFVKIGLSKI
jgi:hypothetical protein